jgi:GH18 family chitinase
METTHKNRLRWMRIASLALALFLFMGSMPGANAWQGATGTKRVVGYLTNWSYENYHLLDYSALTHLNIAFCNPDFTGELDHGFPDDAILRSIIARAHREGVKVLASLGGWGGYAHYTSLTSVPLRQAFNTKIMSFLERYGFDGVDIDVEGDAPDAYWLHFEGWIQSLRQECDARSLILSQSVSTWYSDKISDDAFAYFDFINVMAYDGDYSDHSPYSLALDMLSHLAFTRGIPMDKLVLGVPFYGFRGNSSISYRDIMEQYPVAWRYDSVGGITYNGIETIKRKALLGKFYGGVMIWELGMDVQGRYSLLGAIDSVMDE